MCREPYWASRAQGDVQPDGLRGSGPPATSWSACVNTPPDYCHQLASMICDTHLSDVGGGVRHALTRTLIDTIGVIVAGGSESFAHEVKSAMGVHSGMSAGKSGCTVIDDTLRLAPGGAVMVNGTLGHGWDFDDVHVSSLAHFSTIVIPATLAACEHFGADGTMFLEAVLVGDEVGGRIGSAVCAEEWGGSAIRSSGFFATSVLGSLAAAAAVAKVAKLTHAQTAHALAIAASHACGLAGVSRGDNSTKRTQAGWAAAAGFAAALLAQQNFTGPRAALETEQGFFNAFTDNRYHPKALLPDPGIPWIVEQMSFKAYPLEYLIHPLAELAARARDTIRPRLEEVTCIEASVASKFVTLFTPQDRKIAPAAPYEALTSAPYCIARALLKPGSGELNLSDFRESYVLDEQTISLARKVEFVADSALDRSFPEHIGGRLRFKSGERVLGEDRCADVYGSCSRPMDDAAIERKFRGCCPHWEESRISRTLELLRTLQTQVDSAWILQLGRESPRA